MSTTPADLLMIDMQASIHLHIGFDHVGIDKSQILLTVEFRDAEKKHQKVELRLSTCAGLQQFLLQMKEQAKATLKCAYSIPLLPGMAVPPPGVPPPMPAYD